MSLFFFKASLYGGQGGGRAPLAVAFMLGDNTNKILRLKALTDIGCRSIAGPDPDRDLD